jgi:hypothetical protein
MNRNSRDQRRKRYKRPPDRNGYYYGREGLEKKFSSPFLHSSGIYFPYFCVHRKSVFLRSHR